jgi:RimJ/RimL family protein N-acetyltransferase
VSASGQAAILGFGRRCDSPRIRPHRFSNKDASLMSPLLDGLSLGWKTELIFTRFDGEVIEHGDHLCVRTPANPTYWWGNFLLFTAPPREGDLARWKTLFEDEVERSQPESRHRTFGVDTRERFALPTDFLAEGYTLAASTVLTLSPAQLRAPASSKHTAARLCVLDLARDAAAVVDKQLAVDGARYEPVGYRLFAERQMARYAAMQAAGLGHWFGLELLTNGVPALAASCGLFRGSPRDGLGRFQYVTTHPAWRRRGLCTVLVHAASLYGFERMGLRTLAMVADPDDVAIGIYESLGYRRGPSSLQIERPSL